MKRFRPSLWLMLASFLALLPGCEKGPAGTEEVVVDIRPLSARVAEGTLAAFVFPTAGLTQPSYSGTVGTVQATFGRVNDSTVAVVVPPGGTGNVPVRIRFGTVTGGTTIQVVAGEEIADPVARVDGTVARAMELYIQRPLPEGYGTGWSADSAAVRSRVAQARGDFAQLSPAEQLEIARLLGNAFDLAAAGGTAGARQSSAVTATSTAEDCKAAVVSWVGSTEAMETLEQTYLALSEGTRKKAVVGAFAALHYVGSAIQAAAMSQRCTFEIDFAATSQPFATAGKDFPDATAVWVRAGSWIRTIPREQSDNSVVGVLSRARRKLERAAVTLGLAEPLTGEVDRKAGNDVPVHPSRIELQTTEVTAADGSVVRLGFLQAGEYVVVRPLSTLLQPLNAPLVFAVSGGHEYGEAAVRTFTATVAIPSVCHESGGTYRGCVDRVEITPSSQAIGIGTTFPFTARVWDHFGSEVTGRPLQWSSTPASVATIGVSTGIATGVAEGEAVIAAVSTGQAQRRAVALLKVADVDSTAIYEQAVLGRWTVSSISSPSSTYPWELSMEPSGAGDDWKKATYHVPAAFHVDWYCPNSSATPVNGVCPYAGSWRIVRSNGRYYLMDSGFWHPAYGGEPRDPLTFPVTGFTTYSNFSPTEPSRRFSR